MFFAVLAAAVCRNLCILGSGRAKILDYSAYRDPLPLGSRRRTWSMILQTMDTTFALSREHRRHPRNNYYFDFHTTAIW